MKPRILFADNDRRIRQYCKRELESQGYSVVLAEDGDEAAAVAESSKVDVAILDEHMPRCSGCDAARNIRRQRSDVPIILFTGDADFESFHGAFVDRTVVKSADLEPLHDAITDLLRQKRQSALAARDWLFAELTGVEI